MFILLFLPFFQRVHFNVTAQLNVCRQVEYQSTVTLYYSLCVLTVQRPRGPVSEFTTIDFSNIVVHSNCCIETDLSLLGNYLT